MKSTLHLGQTKPLIFSTTPRIGTFTFLQKLISFLTSIKATSFYQICEYFSLIKKSQKITTCGVVTMIAPVMPHELKYCTIDKCSSDVPGGVSITK